MHNYWLHIKLNSLKLGLISGFIGYFVQTNAQDAHFSLQNSAPLLCNPALAGNSNSNHLILSSRTQWRAVPAPFNTLYASIDLLLASQSNWKFIGGFDAMNDRSGDPTLIKNGVNFYFGTKVKTSNLTALSAAVGIGYQQSSLKPENGKWASQFNGFEYDPTALSGEIFATTQLSHITSSAGLLFNYSTNMDRGIVQSKKEFKIGIAGYNLNQPENSFFEMDDIRLPIRFSVFSSAEFALKGKTSSILPFLNYQRQGNFQEFIVGSAIKYNLKDPKMYSNKTEELSWGYGLYWRLKDAVIVKIMLDWSSFSLALGYDVNISSLHSVSDFRGGLEFAINYRW